MTAAAETLVETIAGVWGESEGRTREQIILETCCSWFTFNPTALAGTLLGSGESSPELTALAACLANSASTISAAIGGVIVESVTALEA